MKQYYVQILCFITMYGKRIKYIEEGFLEDHQEYLIYRDLQGNSPEVCKSMEEFKKDFVHNVKDFDKYVNLMEFK